MSNNFGEYSEKINIGIEMVKKIVLSVKNAKKIKCESISVLLYTTLVFRYSYFPHLIPTNSMMFLKYS